MTIIAKLQQAVEYAKGGDVLVRVRDYDKFGTLEMDSGDAPLLEGEIESLGDAVAFAELGVEAAHLLHVDDAEQEPGDGWALYEHRSNGTTRRVDITPAWTREQLDALRAARAAGPRAGILEQIIDLLAHA